MKKLISFFIIAALLFTAAACASGSTAVVDNTRGSISVAYDNELTKELLDYFQANQSVIITTGVLLDAETDYDALAAKVSVALLKDEAIAEKLKTLGWTETEDWTEAQKKANDEMFRFIVLVSPEIDASDMNDAKLLTNWLVGDGSYETTISTMSGSCSCKRTETKVTITSDAPELCKDAHFAALVNP